MRRAGQMMLLLGTVWAVPSVSGQTLYQEEDGVVVMEVESSPPTGMWKPERSLQGFTGKGYYTWKGPNRFKQPGSGVLVYRFLVTQDGQYRLALHNRHDFHDSTEQNDCFTSMDGGRWIKTFSSRRGEWTWHTRHELSHNDKPPATYRLTAGLHTLQLSGRSAGFSIDRIHLYRDGTAGGEDAARAETTGSPPIPTLQHVGVILAAWRNGRLGEALKQAELLTQSTDAAVADDAKQCVDALTSYAAGQRAIIERLREQDPVAAVDLLSLLARRYQPSSLGRELAGEASQLAKEPAVVKERKAREIYHKISQAAAPLLGKGTVSNKKFVQQHLRELRYIAAGWTKLKKTYPDTKSYEQAREIAQQLGLGAAD